jgi:hypothetical protein
MNDERSDPERAFDKAIDLLDEGEVEKGEALLALVIASARQARGSTLLVRALCVMGELLHDLGRDGEAMPLLREVVAMDPGDPDVVAYERSRARRILEEHES